MDVGIGKQEYSRIIGVIELVIRLGRVDENIQSSPIKDEIVWVHIDLSFLLPFQHN